MDPRLIDEAGPGHGLGIRLQNDRPESGFPEPFGGIKAEHAGPDDDAVHVHGDFSFGS